MLYRAAAVLIVVFWIAMTALLVRKELSPGATALREVPVSHVMKLMFLHAQASDLNLHGDGKLLGALRIHPQVRADDGARMLEVSGRLLVSLPGAPRQRISWGGSIEMNRTLEMRTSRLQINFAEPNAYAVNLLIDPKANRLHYQTHSAGTTLTQGDFPLEAKGAYQWMREQGIDPALFQSSRAPAMPHPTFRAWESSIQIHGQKLDTYRVAVEHGGHTLLEFHVNQIGQVLQAKTFLGYTAAPEDVIP